MLAGAVPWPQDLAQSYRRIGYWRSELLGDLLRHPARREPDRVALVHDRRRLRYEELDARADRLAAGLARLGVARQKCVVVQLPNRPELIVALVALFRLGAIPVMALPPLRQSEITYLCEHTDAVAYLIPDVHQGFDYRTLAGKVLPAAP